MDLTTATQLAQILTPLFLAGALFMAVLHYVEFRKNRRQAIRPKLLFERGQTALSLNTMHEVPVAGGGGTGQAPGQNRKWEAADAWATLTNHGAGPALATTVVYIADQRGLSGETIPVTEAGRLLWPFDPESNRVSCLPANIDAGSSARLRSLPASMTVQYEMVGGTVRVDYEDLDRRRYYSLQEFRATRSQNPGSATSTLKVEFGEETSTEPGQPQFSAPPLALRVLLTIAFGAPLVATSASLLLRAGIDAATATAALLPIAFILVVVIIYISSSPSSE